MQIRDGDDAKQDSSSTIRLYGTRKSFCEWTVITIRCSSTLLKMTVLRTVTKVQHDHSDKTDLNETENCADCARLSHALPDGPCHLSVRTSSRIRDRIELVRSRSSQIRQAQGGQRCEPHHPRTCFEASRLIVLVRSTL